MFEGEDEREAAQIKVIGLGGGGSYAVNRMMEAQFTGPSKEQMETLMNTLEANVDEPIIERGNDARMSYGDRFVVKFVKEDGVWKLKDLD